MVRSKERDAAIAAGATRYFTGRPCKRGHVAERNVSSWFCVACRPKDTRRRVDTRKGRVNNPSVLKAALQRYAKRHPERIAAKDRARKAAMRAPSWADRIGLLMMYAAGKLARLTFPEFEPHVDHVYPLRGKVVSGLHVHYNLQIITAAANREKKNKMPEVI